MMGHKGFIAGGCFKNIFNNEKVKDLDIFFENEKDFVEAVKYYDDICNEESGDFRFRYENDKVKAYKHKKSNIAIELICHTYGTAEEILSKFDFTITKFAYYKESVEEVVENPFTDEREVQSHIEYKILCHDLFFEHLHQNRLVIDDQILFPASTFDRTYRYAKYGYFPCKESKIKLIQAIREMESIDDMSKSLYDGFD